MTYDCSCDYGDAPIFYCATKPHARKEHVCEECGVIIRPGEQYERVSAKWDGYTFVNTICTCERCYDLRVWTKNNVPCLCVMHGNMDEEIRLAVESATERAPDETSGLWFGMLRRFVLRDRYNKQSKAA